MSDPHTAWSTTLSLELTPELADELLDRIPDDLWATAACAERIVDDVQVAQVLVKTGLRRSQKVEDEVKAGVSVYEPLEEGIGGEKDESSQTPLMAYLKAHARERRLCLLRRVLFKRLDRIQTYLIMSTQWRDENAVTQEAGPTETEDDPWADDDDTSPQRPPEEYTPHAPFTLSDFLTQPLLDSAFLLTSTLQFEALKSLIEHHSTALLPYRFGILDAVPLYAEPVEYRELLPANDFDTNTEVLPNGTPWKPKASWVESDEVEKALKASLGSGEEAWLEGEDESEGASNLTRENKPVSAEALTSWYKSRVLAIDEQAGLTTHALALLQHGASQGVIGLDELGEDLILLDRLVYEAPQSNDPSLTPNDWTLARWQKLDPKHAIIAYLRYSTPGTIAPDIRRLVLPYLSVLESRYERLSSTGPPVNQQIIESHLSQHLLYTCILQSPLPLALPIFEASKPTITPTSNRIIRTDEDLARLALAYLYGSDLTQGWEMMSGIFECLPDWGSERDESGDEVDTSLTSLAAFFAPSTTKTVTPEELYVFFKPLHSGALSRALDVLDAHLEGGEVLAKWGVQAPLGWFLRSSTDKAEQMARAVMMARRSGADNEEEWRALLDDMLKLGRDVEHVGTVRGAFGLLNKREIARVYFEALLSSGNFGVAKSILVRSTASRYLTGPVVEEICLATSRELYDNASSGNLHRGEMKLAYECLVVSPPTTRIARERAFIEATSKISSFHITSPSGNLLTPLEIRLTKDRLTLIARILSSTDDAFKHMDVMLDIVEKLGYTKDGAHLEGATGSYESAEVKVLAMLADAALQAEDFGRAVSSCERMVKGARQLRLKYPPHDMPLNYDASQDPLRASAEQAIEVCWHSCFQLGRQSEFRDTQAKLRLLGFALELCPTTNTFNVLGVWRRIEAEDIEERKQAVQKRKAKQESRTHRSVVAPPQAHNGHVNGALHDTENRSRPASLAMAFSPLVAQAHHGQDIAATVLGRVSGFASSLPFSVSGRGRSSFDSDRPQTPGSPQLLPSAPDVADTARRAFSRGVGWLIGDDK